MPLAIVAEGCGPLWKSRSKVSLKMEGRGILQDLIPDMGHLEFGYVSVKGWIIDPVSMASLMVLVIVCASIPTMEKLSTLMQ